MSNGYTQAAVGRQLYLHQGPTPTSSVTISSHGGFLKSTQTLDLRQIHESSATSLYCVTVYFFKQHGYSTPLKIANGLLIEPEHAHDKYSLSLNPSSGRSSVIINYELSKFEDDTKKHIFSEMKKADDRRPAQRPPRDVVTIRNRTFGDTITLDTVIRKLVPLGYKNFYCLFCRSPMEEDTIRFQKRKDDTDQNLRAWKKGTAADFGKSVWDARRPTGGLAQSYEIKKALSDPKRALAALKKERAGQQRRLR